MICKNCSQRIPGRVKVDGKIRVLSSRKYCLDCSPFNQHNTKKIHIPGNTMGNRINTTHNCKVCNNVNIHKKNTRNGKDVCARCLGRIKKLKMKERCVEYKGGQCNNCGYNKSLRALVFHHVNPSKKEFGIASNYRGWDKTKKELDKCVLLCSNCHMEEHDVKNTEWYTSILKYHK